MLASMFRKVASFECRYQMGSPVFLVMAVLFFLLAFGNVVSSNVQIAAIGNVNVNSPDAIVQVHVVMSIIALFIATAFLANPAIRDFEHRSAELLFATQLTKPAYLLGRFSGGYLAALLAFSTVSIGMVMGTQMPALDPARINDFQLSHYVYTYAVFVLPNLFFSGALAFALATMSRSLMWTYVGIVVFVLLQSMTQSLLDQPEWRQVAAWLDPFGSAAYTETVRYWTAFERNTQLAPLNGLLLQNRLLWLAVSSLLLMVSYVSFQLQLNRGSGREQQLAMPKARPPEQVHLESRAHGEPQVWPQFFAQLRFEVKSAILSTPFLIVLILAVISTWFAFLNLDQFFGTPVYPLTRVMTNIMQGTFTLSLLIVVIYYGAEMVWRDRQYSFQEIIDVTPAPNWVFVGAKTTALLLVVFLLLLAGVITAVIAQLSQNYYTLELKLYVTRYLLDYGRLFYFAAILSIFIQNMVRNKFLGMGFMVIYVVVMLFAMRSLGFEDPLYRFGTRADVAYSDMNGWGHFAAIAIWYAVYWGSACILMYIATYLLWQRGTLQLLELRARGAMQRFGLLAQISAVLALLTFIGSGIYIFYNTRILNTYITAEDITALRVCYEQRFIDKADVAQPRIAAISTQVDLYPDTLSYQVHGRYRLENRSEAAIDRVYIGFHPIAEVSTLALEDASLSSRDDEFNYFEFTLNQALEPGESLQLQFHSGRRQEGFRHARNNPSTLGVSALLDNGTFVFNNEAFPYIGFNKTLIIDDPYTRRSHGLPELNRYADLEDESAYGNSYLRQDSDWIEFDTTVSTRADQIAIAPGYLEREWETEGRRYFHYRMDAPMQNLFAYLSARYERVHTRWNEIDIEVFYHADHEYNVGKMLQAVQQSLAYYSEHFGPYQYRQMRIIEFPVVAGKFAVAFPNTVPWSEGIGFIADVESPTDVDYVFYVGAHEVAHQWWGHQVSSANVQGQTLLIETLAQYSALMVMEEAYGPHLMRRFLKYELDQYLSNRGKESEEELPLYRVENQPYIHYRKGSLAMYALKDYLGAERINQALRAFATQYAYQSDPYPTANDLLAELKAVAETEEETQLIEDLFERIVLWDLEAIDATAQLRGDGRYDVSITVRAEKLESNGIGHESILDLYMPIDLGVFTANPDDQYFSDRQVISLQKEIVEGGQSTFHFTTDRQPRFAGIDPYNKLIDRNAEDNLVPVRLIQ
jgi:hypothetical protein